MGEDWVLNHVGLMVTNRNAALRHFQSIGMGVSVGPQPLLPHEPGQGSLMYYRTLEGEPVTNTYATGGAHLFTDGESQIGDCQLECVAMKPGPGMFINEYLAKCGPGINHICFNAPMVEEDTQILLSKNCDLMFNAMVNGKTVENYLDTRLHGDLMISLRPPASDWENTWKANNVSHPLVSDWTFIGVGIGVKCLDTSISYYARLGFDEVCEETFDDKTGIRSRTVKVGPLNFDFYEMTKEDSVYSDSMSTRGDGVNDIAFTVDDLETEISRLELLGVRVLARSGDRRTAYIDTRAEGNIMTRLVTER
ncbi:MAG: hypothetical protein HOI43_14910 [Gammaproteobacteria bacterium]|nr:hypothetical protein [Gammaproteobacteria bacterium]MBT6246706.1 hypothetical protein [Gammaproteobacteria bacterium]